MRDRYRHATTTPLLHRAIGVVVRCLIAVPIAIGALAVAIAVTGSLLAIAGMVWLAIADPKG